MAGSNTNRFEYIDALRGWAIFGVILTHAASLVGIGGLSAKVAAFGGYGVQLFFVVSGFTIFLVYQKGLAAQKHPAANFFTRRLFRIVPIYWAGIVLYSAVYGMDSRGWQPGPELWHIPLHVLLINLLHPAATSSVVPGGWSISCEVLFYLTVPLWVALIRSTRAALVFCVAAMVAAPILIQVMRMCMGDWVDTFGAQEAGRYYYRSLFSQLACFAFGILMYFLVCQPARWLEQLKQWRWNLLLCATAATVFVVGALHLVPFPRAHHLYAASFMLLGVALSQVPWKLLVNRAVIYLGRISYSAYLVHFLVLKQLSLVVDQGGWSKAAYFGVIASVGFAFTVVLASISFRWIEQPFQNMAGRIVKRRENSASRVGASDPAQSSSSPG